MKKPKDLPIIQPRPWDGSPIKMPGVYSGIPIEKYHSGDICVEPSISSSGLRTIFNQSPLHYWDRSPYNPERNTDAEESKSLTLGRAAHHLLLGEAKFNTKFVIRPETLGGERWNGNRTACKLWIEEREGKGLTVLNPSDAEMIIGMAKNLARDRFVKAGLLDGHIECSFFWKDAETGVWLKARPDAMPSTSLDFADLKSTKSVADESLQYAVRDYGYYQQAGLVSEACHVLFKQWAQSFTFVFIESARPHCVRPLIIKEVDIERGIRANRAALRTFAKCWKAKEWPGPGGYAGDFSYIEMRDWDQKDIDSRIDAAHKP